MCDPRVARHCHVSEEMEQRMALTRRTLEAMGIEQGKIDEIISMHTETTDALKHERDGYKADSERAAELEKKLEEATRKLEAVGTDSYREKYEAKLRELEDYRAEVSAREEHSRKLEAYRGVLREAGVSAKRIDSVLRVSDVDSIELDEDGRVKGSDDLVKGIRDEWSDFVEVSSSKGADVEEPPSGGGDDGDDVAKMRHALGLDAYDKE